MEEKEDVRVRMFEEIEGAHAIIPAIAGYDRARVRALEIAAFISIFEHRQLSEKEFHDLYRDFRKEEGYNW